MITFLTLAAAFGTIGIFLYMLSVYDNTKMDKSEAKRNKIQSERTGTDPKKVFNEKWDKNIPRPRICPVCGTYLEKHEFLYASISEPIGKETKKQAHIYGCRYCYMGLVDKAQKTSFTEEPYDKNFPEPEATLDL